VLKMEIHKMQIEDAVRPEKRKCVLTQEERIRRKKRKRKRKLIRIAAMGMTAALSFALIAGIIALVFFVSGRTGRQENKMVLSEKIQILKDGRHGKWQDFYAAELPMPSLDVELLTVNEFSRPGIALPEVKNIFIHYTANEGTTALQNRSYFESLAETHERSASAHFIIGCDGEVVQCIPTGEIAYAVMKRNYDSISIECCYEREDGQFTDRTYQSLIELTAWLLHKYELAPEDVLRHYDEGGKICPKYYVENEAAWEQFLADLSEYMEQRAGMFVNL
jgi:N-acetylmuramoyl-L-alanine amidase